MSNWRQRLITTVEFTHMAMKVKIMALMCIARQAGLGFNNMNSESGFNLNCTRTTA